LQWHTLLLGHFPRKMCKPFHVRLVARSSDNHEHTYGELAITLNLRRPASWTGCHRPRYLQDRHLEIKTCVCTRSASLSLWRTDIRRLLLLLLLLNSSNTFPCWLGGGQFAHLCTSVFRVRAEMRISLPATASLTRNLCSARRYHLRVAFSTSSRDRSWMWNEGSVIVFGR
jgi:hypothetical protein